MAIGAGMLATSVLLVYDFIRRENNLRGSPSFIESQKAEVLKNEIGKLERELNSPTISLSDIPNKADELRIESEKKTKELAEKQANYNSLINNSAYDIEACLKQAQNSLYWYNREGTAGFLLLAAGLITFVRGTAGTAIK